MSNRYHFSGQPRKVPISPRPELEFEPRIAALEEAFSGRLGFHAVRLADGESVELRADERFPTASVIKVAVCCAVLEMVARGETRFDQAVGVGERVPGGGILKQLELESATLRDAIELTVTVSDNVATNMLLSVCPAERVNSWAAAVGLEQTRIFGPIRGDFAGGIGVSTPREQTRLLRALAREEILTGELCRHLLGVLGRQHYQDQIPRWLPFNPYAQYHGRGQELTIANKTGELDGVRADAALLVHRERGTVAVAVFTDGGADLRETVDVEGALAVAECGAAIAARLLGLDT